MNDPRHRSAIPGGLRAALSLLPALSTAGCYNALEIPSGPDLRDIAVIYDAPDGHVDAASIEEAVEQASQAMRSIYGLGRLDFVVSSLTQVSDSLKGVAEEDANTIRDISGSTVVTTICPGDKSEPTARKDNGQIEYQATFHDSYLDDTVWGEFSACQFHDSGERFFEYETSESGPGSFEGSLDVYLGEKIPFSDLHFDSFLFRLLGDLELPGGRESLELDFRTDGATHIELRIPAREGDVVFLFASDVSHVGLETARGSFCCDFEERTCALLASGSCQEPQYGDETISW